MLKKRVSSLALGALTAAAALLLALMLVAGSESVFGSTLEKSGVFEAGWFYGGTPESFARETMDYIGGVSDTWAPALTLSGGEPLQISPEFTEHMTEVRGIFRLGWGVLAALLIACAAAFALSREISLPAYLAGAGLALLPGVAIGVWALFDFDGLWRRLHETFLPGGLFPASETIVHVFEPAFSYYLLPLLTASVISLAVMLTLPPIIKRGLAKCRDTR